MHTGWPAVLFLGCLGVNEARPAGPPTPRLPIVVRVEKTSNGHRLLRGGLPYFVKGVGGQTNLALLAKLGGNSIRTWGADDLGKVLDEAHRHKLTVLAGIWLGQERQGFNYNDAGQVADQHDMARRVILRHRNHPALLAWGIGNEMEGKGDNAAVWSAINNLASLARRLDPNHPTVTVLAEVGDKIKHLHRLCPDIDIVGINSYGGVSTLPARYRAAGGVKPYLLTEFGPAGTWELKKNAWGAVPEPTSTAKARQYRQAYEKAVVAARGQCLGSYAFLWGQKQEATATWFGMLLPGGKRLAAADVMQELWTGRPPANRCPEVRSLKLVGSDEVNPGATVTARMSAVDPEGDRLTVRWLLQREGESFGEGGDAEDVPPTYPAAILQGTTTGARVRMPKEGGVYRLFVFVEDGAGGAATGNVLLRVKGPLVAPAARKALLPLVVYDEVTRKAPPYAPTGWMGNAKATKMDPAATDRPHAGKTCIRVDYTQNDGWAGIVWQHPANDWGNRPGGWDLRGAKKLTFWARGQRGGEVVSFELGLLGKDKRFADSARAKLPQVKLGRDWKQYTIDLGGKDLSRIKTGFSCTWAGAGKPLTFYLDDIRYE